MDSILLFFVKRNIVRFYKEILGELEGLKFDNEQNKEYLYKTLQKIGKNLDIDLGQLCNYEVFDENKYQFYRKKILDKANDLVRLIEDEFKKYTIRLI